MELQIYASIKLRANNNKPDTNINDETITTSGNSGKIKEAKEILRVVYLWECKPVGGPVAPTLRRSQITAIVKRNHGSTGY
jgi:hypothetical protein